MGSTPSVKTGLNLTFLAGINHWFSPFSHPPDMINPEQSCPTLGSWPPVLNIPTKGEIKDAHRCSTLISPLCTVCTPQGA